MGMGPDAAGQRMEEAFLPGLLNRLPVPPSKVAVLRASRIGDFICATPAFRALRAALPEAQITLITLPMLQELAMRSPYFNCCTDFPGFPGLAEQFFDAHRALDFFVAMQAERYDLAIQLQGSGVYTNPFMLMLGARLTAGFIRPGDGPGRLDAALPFPEQGHEVRRALALVEFLGAPAQGETTEFRLWPEDNLDAVRLLTGIPRPWIGLHTAARQSTRRWPLERFALAGRELQHRLGGTLVVIGEPGERANAEKLAELAAVPVLNLAGRTSLGTLGGVIAQLDLLVTNDTGPAHIAYALGTPTVTIFGGGDLARYGPPVPGPFHLLAHPVPCRPCAVEKCPIDDLCLKEISVEQVIRASEALLMPRDNQQVVC